MSKDKTGGLKGNLEWGKDRKHEDRLRGRNNRARRETIAEQVCDCEWNQSDDALVAQYGCGCES